MTEESMKEYFTVYKRNSLTGNVFWVAIFKYYSDAVPFLQELALESENIGCGDDIVYYIMHQDRILFSSSYGTIGV